MKVLTSLLCLLVTSFATAGVVDLDGGRTLRLTNVVGIAAAERNYAAVILDGSVVEWEAWATNATPVAGVSNAVFVAAGYSHFVAVKEDGTVTQWIRGNAVDSPPSSITNVLKVAAGRSHSVALLKDGRLDGWGQTSSGQLSFPRDRAGFLEVAAGDSCTVAITANRTVEAWGQLAGGSPITVPPGLSNVVAISAGSSFAAAVLSNGNVVTWSDSSTNWDLGYTNAVALSAKGTSALILRADGAVEGLNKTFARASGVKMVALGVQKGFAAGDCVIKSIQNYFGGGLEAARIGQRKELLILRVDGGDVPPRYQWSFEGRPLADGTNETYVIEQVAQANAGWYRLEISNQFNTITVTRKLYCMGPPNDNFSEAQQIPPWGGRVTSLFYGATAEPGEPVHFWADRKESVWFKWTASAAGQVTVDTVGSTLADPALVVYIGDGITNLVRVAADDDSGIFGLQAEVSFDAAPSITYYIAVVLSSLIGYVSGANEGVMLNVRVPQPVVDLRVSGGGREFKFQVGGFPGRLAVVEASEDLRVWAPVSTNVAPESGVLTYVDTGATAGRSRFFRSRFY